MERRRLLPVALAAGALLVAGPAAAAGGGSAQHGAAQQDGQQQNGQQVGQPERITVTQEPDALPQDQLRTLTIVVTEVDRQNHRVQFEAQVDPEATVQHEGQELAIDQLQPGDAVRASFDPQTGEVQRMVVVERGAPGAQQQQQPGAQQQPGMQQPEIDMQMPDGNGGQDGTYQQPEPAGEW